GYLQGLTEGRRDEPLGTMPPQSIAPDSSTPQDQRYRVTLTNPAHTGYGVNYAIDGCRYRLEPGEIQVLRVRSSSLITFDRGGGSAQAMYRLPEGAYQFTFGEQGWNLKRAAEPPAGTSTTNLGNPAPELSNRTDD